MITKEKYLKAQETIKLYEKQLVLEQVATPKDYLDKLALCWYPKDKYGGHELELYFCKVLERNGEYIKAQLYNGETYDPKRKAGIVDDVCFNDLVFDKEAFK